MEMTVRFCAAPSAGQQKAASSRRWKRPRHKPQRDQCTNRAIRMMIGIGTPRKNSSNERMVMLLD
ncbi:hypothetical protein DLD99_17570 [Pseudomonas kribbensis]|uniref:Uncharacterized protein n=1 Tax=Pseudomonas kribbensis TaxID=1628086 RepID=A0A345RSD7_9PSED|nr:hypothetical protein DLD99_17570 [Pseudomonas kribbensis]